MLEERNTFIGWTVEAVLTRSPWLQSAVVSLGLGVILLPVAFLEIQDLLVWIASLAFVIIALLLPRRESLFNRMMLFLRTKGIIH